jgi:hypothetical protein
MSQNIKDKKLITNQNSTSVFEKLLHKIPAYFKMASALIQLYLLPVIEMKYNWTEENYQVI